VEENAQAERIPGALVEYWELGTNQPNLALGWVNPNARYLLTAPVIDIQSAQAFNLPNHRLELFALRYTGQVYVPRDGMWTFWTCSDDGSQLFINGQMIVNNDGLHGPQWAGGNVQLTEGNHEFRLDFFQNYGGGYLLLHWQGPGVNREVTKVYQPAPDVTRTQLARPIARFGVNVRFWTFNHQITSLAGLFNGNPSKTMQLTTPFINIVDRAQFNSGAQEYFSAEYTGKIVVPVGGGYSFWTLSDDGSQLFIDNSLVVNNDGLHPPQWAGNTVNLAAGPHDIKVLFFQNGGGGYLRVDWAGPTIARNFMPIVISVGG